MSITMSINTVGIVRAAEMLQSARNEALQSADGQPQTTTVEIGRSVDAEARALESDRPLPASQKRVVDIRV